jgi:site-specific DNA-methyltransferase (adenine-specific)
MITLMQGDCLERMKGIPDGSVDMILADPPYGTTACKWDSIIPLEPMWAQLKRIIKPNGAIVMTAAQPFTSVLVSSNLSMFKYDWVWEKPSAKGHLNAKKQPMRAHESILVFYDKQPTYNPQMTDGHVRKVSFKRKELNSEVYSENTSDVSYDSTRRYPRSVQNIKQDTQKCSLHPTQKPVALMEYLIKTYTNEAETVLDFTMGSGTTGVACVNLNRSFIGIELDENYFNIASDRISKAIDTKNNHPTSV